MSDPDQQSVASTSRPASPVPPLPDFANARPYRFAWDAATRKAGPASVSGTSEGRGDYFAYRPALGNFNFSSASLAVGAIPSDWSSAKHGFNAISTLVNSPHKKSAPPKAHAAVPPVIPSQLPRVRRKDFDAYLKAVAPEWEQYERARQLGQEGQADAFAAGLAEMELEPPATPRTPRFTPGASIPSLDSVPSIFFNSSFDLSEPRTFAAVTEQREGDELLDPSALSRSLPLLEKLSHYADTIELHLIREISLRSSSFFAALTNLNELQSESTQCLERIRKLRGMLREVDEGGAKKGLEIVRLERKIKNLGDVRVGVNAMQSIGEMLSLARTLASGGEWEAALGLVEELEKLWRRDSTQQQAPESVAAKPTLASLSRSSKRNSMLTAVPESIKEESESASSEPFRTLLSIPLSSLNAFASLPENLRVLTMEIASSLTSEFVSVLKTDLLYQMDSQNETNHESVCQEVDESRNERLTMLRDRLRPLAQGLKRTSALKDALGTWTVVALVEIRLSIKKHLPSSEGLDDEDPRSTPKNDVGQSTGLRDALREKSHEDFISLLRTILGTLLNGIQELQTQNDMILEVGRSLQSSEPTETSSLQDDLSDILFSATELAHSKASKIISPRAEQHAALDFLGFLDVFNETWNFVIRTETICRRMIVGLRCVIVSQAKTFLQTMHQDRISQSAKLVEEEQWSAAEVSSAAQVVVNVIVDSAMRDAPELLVSSMSPISHSQTNGTRPSSSKQLSIEDRKYYAVSATLKMTGLLIDYLKILANLSLLTTDTVGRVIEFLKSFNSRTCQVVLGAGAMRSAGLKNITAKHLALASQSLSIVIALIPYVRECFRRHLNPKQAVMLVEFDKLKRDYQEHQHEIHSKLIAIMGDRLSAHCKTLQAVDWSASRDGVNEYMTVLVKETVTLHKVLSRYLQEAALEYIMSQVFAAINHRLSEEYGKIELPSQEAKERLLHDARYLHQNFSNLKNVNASTGMLETVIGEKQVRLAGGAQAEQAERQMPAQITSANNSPVAHGQTQPHSLAASTMESANERLRGIFRRSSTFRSSDSKATATPPSLRGERKDSSFFPEKIPVQEPDVSSRSPPPPPTPEKLGSDTMIARPLSPVPMSPLEGQRARSPRAMEKALPIPLPTLDADGNIIDPPDILPSSPAQENGVADSARLPNGSDVTDDS